MAHIIQPALIPIPLFDLDKLMPLSKIHLPGLHASALIFMKQSMIFPIHHINKNTSNPMFNNHNPIDQDRLYVPRRPRSFFRLLLSEEGALRS